MVDIKTGSDNKGAYAIIYGGAERVRWLRGADAESLIKTPSAPAAPPAVSAAVASLNALTGVVGSVAAVAQAVGSLLQWWEARQTRLHSEAREGTNLRLTLVADLLDRWVVEHATLDHVDLEISHYLAREALGLLRFAGTKDDVVIPQALLYEVERIRQIVGRLREVVARQFIALEAAGIEAVVSPVEGARSLRINYANISKFYVPPNEDWDRAVESKNLKAFDADLQQIARKPDELLSRMFEVTGEEQRALAVSLSSTAALVASTGVPGTSLNLGKVVFALLAPQAAVLTMFLLPLLEKFNNDAEVGRKDAIRELALFASEVERTRLLVRAWNVLDRTVAATQGVGLLVTEVDGRPLISALSNEGFEPVQKRLLETRRASPLVRSAPGAGHLLLAPADNERSP